jgi:predicted  nucleic acid-binding Zn-ribbon protein
VERSKLEVQAMSANGVMERIERVLSTAPLAPVADSWQRKVEAGMRAAHELEQERDMAAKALADCRTELRGLQAEHDALRLAHARLQTEVEAYRRDRDDAVERRTAAETLIDGAIAVLSRRRAELDEKQI